MKTSDGPFCEVLKNYIFIFTLNSKDVLILAVLIPTVSSHIFCVKEILVESNYLLGFKYKFTVI